MGNQPQKLNTVDEQGNITGEGTRENIHRDGLLHREVHVWFYTPKGEIIFQLRGKDKDTYPNLLDATVGGHVELGESFEEAALKEMEEETGVTAKISELSIIETTRNKSYDPVTKNTNNAMRVVYAYKYVGPLENLLVEENKAYGFEAWTFEKILSPSEAERKRVIPTLLEYKNLEIFKKIQKLG